MTIFHAVAVVAVVVVVVAAVVVVVVVVVAVVNCGQWRTYHEFAGELRVDGECIGVDV